MKIDADQSVAHFARRPLPCVTLITGAEIVLNQESLDAARARARADGYAERLRFDTDGAFEWKDVLAESQSPSLFAPRRVIEVHGTDKRIDKKSLAVFETLLRQCDDNLRVLLYLPELEKPDKQAWFKEGFAGDNLAVISKELYIQDLTRQIDHRLQQADLVLTPSARELLITYCQGNLASAKQAIARLQIGTRTQGAVDEAALLSTLSDAAMFNVFGFTDALWRGQWLAAWRIAGKLEEEDRTQIILLAWLLVRDASVLLHLHAAPHNADAVFSVFRIYGNQKRSYYAAQKRFPPALVRTLLKLSAKLERLAKGVDKGDPWPLLRQFLLLKAQRA